jgi:hypothetical protein
LGIKAHIIAFIEFSVGLEMNISVILLFIILFKEVFMKNTIGKTGVNTILSNVWCGIVLLPGIIPIQREDYKL